MIEQMVMDGKPVDVEIWDAIGRSIYKDHLLFAGAKAKLQMQHIVPGMYLLQLTDNSKQKFRFKFVVD